MSPLCRYYYTAIFHLLPLLSAAATTVDVHYNNNTWHEFMKFTDVKKGSHVTGISELKRHFQRFGYFSSFPHDTTTITNFTDFFDNDFHSSLLSYQRNLGLPVTGKLDSETMQQIISPRCGVSDDDTSHHHKLHGRINFSYFNGKPRWSRKINLMYAFSPNDMIDYISMPELSAIFSRSFSRWSSVIPANFTETKDYAKADIRIGFYRGNHGDGKPFDGVLGIFAHGFSPEDGRLHFDAAETWAVDFNKEESKVAVDLESVATHEIGHILGLAHSSVKEAVMYPTLSPRMKKVDLTIDDVEGIQALYGPNPNFKHSSFFESDLSSGWRRKSSWIICLVGVVASFILFYEILISYHSKTIGTRKNILKTN